MDTTPLEKQIKDIEDEIFNTQKNKATEHHIGKLKAKIARLRGQIEKQQSKGVKGKGFAVKKNGDATIGLIGFPSIGKSTLLNQLTDAKSEVAAYEFTTLDVIPGMLHHKGANLQILDLPGLITGASLGKGRGREILAAVRSVDLILLMVDGTHKDHLDRMTLELHSAGLRLNRKKPDVVITLSMQGGITIHTPIKLTKISEKTIRSIVSEYLVNADVIIREDIDEDQLIDVFIKNRTYIPAIAVINKIDLLSQKELDNYKEHIRKKGWIVHAISAIDGTGLQELKDLIFSQLRLIRIYMKPQGKKPDYNEPMILREEDTVEDVCKKIHRDFKQKFRYAHVWGRSAKYPGQKVGLDHTLCDEDVLTVIIIH
ncbi:MAG: GTP-binding protein [Candidatus Thermoplasmatota archaeon]|nr:GTP-binding protein [Candidatus Thermoplasmatota archaeon]